MQQASNTPPAAPSSLDRPIKKAAHLQECTLKAVVTPPPVDHDICPLLFESAVERLNLQGGALNVSMCMLTYQKMPAHVKVARHCDKAAQSMPQASGQTAQGTF